MSQFDTMFATIKSNDDFEQNARLMTYLGNIVANGNLNKSEIEELKRFVLEEMQRLICVIPDTQNYRTKSQMFYYENELLRIFTFASGGKGNINEEQLEIIKQLIDVVAKETVLETAIDKMFELSEIQKSDVDQVLDIARGFTDEYRKGLIYSGLHEHARNISKMTLAAKEAMSQYIADDFHKKQQKQLSEDDLISLEYAVDVCKYFINDVIINSLKELLNIQNNRVRYFAVETLLSQKEEIPVAVICDIAKDEEFASLLYEVLNKNGKSQLFPKELANEDYLAKSNMVQWLVYPTELGKKPDAIQLMGSIEVKKEKYHIFKFSSDSDNLLEEDKGEWLVGWSSKEGGTFSNFDRLSVFEKSTVEKTVKNIAKKSIKKFIKSH